MEPCSFDQVKLHPWNRQGEPRSQDIEGKGFPLDTSHLKATRPPLRASEFTFAMDGATKRQTNDSRYILIYFIHM